MSRVARICWWPSRELDFPGVADALRNPQSRLELRVSPDANKGLQKLKDNSVLAWRHRDILACMRSQDVLPLDQVELRNLNCNACHRADALRQASDEPGPFEEGTVRSVGSDCRL